jgi:hypothetical protein
MDDTTIPDHPTTATIRPWIDPLVDRHGHDPRSVYVEHFWLGVIGPTATWVLRRLAAGFDEHPDGYTIDLAHLAVSMGLSYRHGDQGPFGRALHRCVMFGLAQPRSDGFSVRRRVPDVTQRHLKRLPDDVQASHADWSARITRLTAADIERRLVEAGVPPHAAALASEAAALAA